MRSLSALGAVALVATASPSSPAFASWRAADDRVAAAAKDPDITAVLGELDALDAALVRDDHAAFAARLSPDLASP